MSKNLLRCFCGIILAALILTSLAACGSKVNQANFDKVEVGMEEEEVHKILGSPTESSGVTIGGFSGETSAWQSKDVMISIQFLNGKVAAKTISKGRPGQPITQQ